MLIKKSTNTHPDFIDLVKLLDIELAERDGDLNSFYDQYNKLDHIKYVLVAYIENLAVGCGAIKEFDSTTMEVKRMYVLEDLRGNGYASQILKELETWAKELNYKSCVLETGLGQPEAIALYKKNGYRITENYGQYKGVDNSVCFKKEL